MTSESGSETVGLIAGSGRFPILFAIEAKRQGHRVAAIGIKDVTDPALGDAADELHTFKLGQVSAPLAALKKAGVKSTLHVVKGRGHGLGGSKIMQMVAEFFDTYLRGRPATTQPSTTKAKDTVALQPAVIR